MTQPGLLVVGSVALDSLQGGLHTDELGGSALYFSLAASLIGPVGLVAPVGSDAVERVRSLLRARAAIDSTGLRVVDAPTYRWFADDGGGHNLDLGSADSIYDVWSPTLPARYRGWAFVGSMRASHQGTAANALAGCGLLAADAMRSYVLADPAGAHAVAERCDWYFCNGEEFAALGGRDPVAFRRRWGLTGLVLKDGPGGATVFTAAGAHHQPAMFDPPAVDTTGAGDALAGAMLARLRELGGAHEAIPVALRWGVAAATIAISAVGTRALARATRTDVERLAVTVDR
jgi:sugar/nucleoside kinase (ribokinase family)